MSALERPLLAVAVTLALLAPAGAHVARADAPAAALAEEGLALVPQDDAASLDRAAELFQEALRADPKLYPARAHRALVELLVGAAQRDEAVRTGDGALLASGRDLRERALDELRPLVREHAHDASVVRTLAVYYAFEGDGARAARLAAEARARGSDPWIDFAETTAAVRSGTRAAAIPRLQAFVASHPAFLRARIMLALAQIDEGRVQEGLATLDDLLASNPRHDVAMREKARLLAPPRPRTTPAPLAHDAPPPQPPGHLPRKRGGAVQGPATRRVPAPLDAR